MQPPKRAVISQNGSCVQHRRSYAPRAADRAPATKFPVTRMGGQPEAIPSSDRRHPMAVSAFSGADQRHRPCGAHLSKRLERGVVMSGFAVDAVALRGIVCCCNVRGALQKFVTHGLKPGCHFTVGLCACDPEISLRPLSKIALIHHVAIPRNRGLSMKLNQDATLRHLGNDAKSERAIPHRHCKLGALIYQYSRREQAHCGSVRSLLCSLAGRIDQIRLINLAASPRFRFSSTFVLDISNYPQRSWFCDQRLTGLLRRSTGSGPLRLTGLYASALRRPRCSAGPNAVARCAIEAPFR